LPLWARDRAEKRIELRDDQRRPELASKFHDNAVRSLPEERAAELGFLTLRASRISPCCWPRRGRWGW